MKGKNKYRVTAKYEKQVGTKPRERIPRESTGMEFEVKADHFGAAIETARDEAYAYAGPTERLVSLTIDLI